MSEKLHYSGVNMRNVKALADKRHVSLTDLAEKIGITYVGLSKIIRENTTTLGTLQRLADALGVPVACPFFQHSLFGCLYVLLVYAFLPACWLLRIRA